MPVYMRLTEDERVSWQSMPPWVILKQELELVSLGADSSGVQQQVTLVPVGRKGLRSVAYARESRK